MLRSNERAMTSSVPILEMLCVTSVINKAWRNFSLVYHLYSLRKVLSLGFNLPGLAQNFSGQLYYFILMMRISFFGFYSH
jgi:hypothetical protein